MQITKTLHPLSFINTRALSLSKQNAKQSSGNGMGWDCQKAVTYLSLSLLGIFIIIFFFFSLVLLALLLSLRHLVSIYTSFTSSDTFSIISSSSFRQFQGKGAGCIIQKTFLFRRFPKIPKIPKI